MVHLQLLAQICSFSFCDLMDACEILKMEGYVSALDEEPDAEESPPSADAAQAHSWIHPNNTGSVAEPDDSPTYKNPFGETEDEAQAHSPKPEIVNMDLGWMHAFRKGSVAEPDDSPTYQNPFGETDDSQKTLQLGFGETEDEAQAHSPTKTKTKGKPKTKGKAKTKGNPKTKGKAKKKAKTKPTSKAKT